MGPQPPAHGGSPRESRRPGSSLRALLFSLALRAGAWCPRSIQVTPICAAPGHSPRPPLGRAHHTPSRPWGSGSTVQCGATGLTGTGWNAGAIAESSACQATGQMGLLPSSHTWLPFLPHLPASCPLLVPGRAAAQPPLGGPLLTSLTTLCHLCFLTQVPSPFLSFQHVVFCHCCWFLVFCFTFSLCEASETRTCGKGKGYVCSCRELKAETYFSARQKRLTL